MIICQDYVNRHDKKIVSDQASNVVTKAPSADKIIAEGGVLKIMIKTYTEEDKQKYCVGFKKCTLPITDYAEKMDIPVEGLKQWLKEYKEPPAFGEIDVASLLDSADKEKEKTSFKISTETIKIELLENYDRNVLIKILELMKVMCNVK